MTALEREPGEARDADLPLIGPVAPPELHVMSFNIRRRMASANRRPADRWQRRAPHLAGLLRTESPSLLGVQEALPDQAEVVRAALGARYRLIGHGRSANGRGEGCPIVFDSDRLELLAWEQSALSDRPSTAGSVSWGNIIPRILVSATFRDRATSARFLAVNTHFDHLSRRSRLRSAQAIRGRVAGQPLPAVVTGDLNTGEDTAPIKELLAGGALTDAWSVSETRLTAEYGTFPNYRVERRDRKRIDWVTVSPDIEVVRAAINPGRHGGGWASDHLPVQAVIVIPTEGSA